MVYLVSEMVIKHDIDYNDIIRKTFYKRRHILASYKFSQTLPCSDESNPCKAHSPDKSHLWIQKEISKCTLLVIKKFYTCLNNCYNSKPWTLQEPSLKHIRPSGHEPRFIPSPFDPWTVQIGLQTPSAWQLKLSLQVPRFVPSPAWPNTKQPATRSIHLHNIAM